MKSEALKAALEARIPELTANYTRLIGQQYDFLVGEFTNTFDNVSNSKYYSLWTETVRRVVVCTNPVEGSRNRTRDGAAIYALNPEAVERMAVAHATETVMAWANKIEGKMGELEKAECLHINGCRFAIVGIKNGNNVRIEQDMILNVSSKGKVFNQFPARIYVNLKFMSEAKFKQL